MNLTKAEAIENHRKMWRWLAEETEKRKCIVEKPEYFREMENWDIPIRMCYCCEYARKFLSECEHCPIDWPGGRCTDKIRITLYDRWYFALDYCESAELARQIAELPEREGV